VKTRSSTQAKGQAALVLCSVEELRMPSDGWIKTLEDGGRVKFTYQDLPGEVAFITAQVEGNKVLYSIRMNQRQEPDQS
jgi:hypothetical protein